jgi:hypothetical protein
LPCERAAEEFRTLFSHTSITHIYGRVKKRQGSKPAGRDHRSHL